MSWADLNSQDNRSLVSKDIWPCCPRRHRDLLVGVSSKSDPTAPFPPLPGIPMCPFSKNPHFHSYPPTPRFVFRLSGPLVTAGCPSWAALRIWIMIHSWHTLPLSKRCDSFPLKRHRERENETGPLEGCEPTPHPWRGTRSGVTGTYWSNFPGEPTLGERPKRMTSRVFPTKQPGSKDSPLLCT